MAMLLIFGGPLLLLATLVLLIITWIMKTNFTAVTATILNLVSFIFFLPVFVFIAAFGMDPPDANEIEVLIWAALIVFGIPIIMAIVSFITLFRTLRRNKKNKEIIDAPVVETIE